MARNREYSVADMRRAQRSKSDASKAKLETYVGVVPRVTLIHEQCSTSLRLRGAIDGESSNYKNHAPRRCSGTTEMNTSDASSSSQFLNSSIPLKGSCARLAPALRNSVSCSPWTSDESGSDLDAEDSEQVMSSLLKSRDTTRWRSLASSLHGKTASLKINEEGLISSRQGKRHSTSPLNLGQRVRVHPERTHVDSSSGSYLDWHSLRGISTLQVSHDRSTTTINSAVHSGVTLPDKKGIFSTAREETFGDTSSSATKVSNQSRQVGGYVGRLENKGKFGIKENSRLRSLTSHGAGCKENSNASSSSIHASGSIGENVDPLGFLLGADILPSVSCFGVADDETIHSIGPWAAMYPSRRGHTELTRRMEFPSSGSPNCQSFSSFHRLRRNSPIISRGRNNLKSASNFNDLSVNRVPTESSHGTSISSSRPSSSDGLQLADTTQVDMGPLSRNRENPPLINAGLDSVERRLSFSGPPPLRPPPPPPGQPASNVAENAFSLLSLNNRSHHCPDLRHTGFSSLLDRDGPGRRTGSPARYNFHSSRLHSSGEFQHHRTVEGLSEVLSVLECIERDDDLTYEQILMLEATVLLGGLGLNDWHRDMRLDVDNMSYEELLALEERIGNAKLGLSEDAIIKCVTRQKYTLPATTTNIMSDDVEIKCSICQEEFEEAVELGLLDCGHRHHLACIEYWLQQKNQCPICKASAFL